MDSRWVCYWDGIAARHIYKLDAAARKIMGTERYVWSCTRCRSFCGRDLGKFWKEAT